MLPKSIIKNQQTLRYLTSARKSARDTYINSAKKEVIDAIIELALSILSGRIQLTQPQKDALNKYANHIRLLVGSGTRRASLTLKKKILQEGGFLSLLLKPALGLIGGLLGPILGGGRR